MKDCARESCSRSTLKKQQSVKWKNEGTKTEFHSKLFPLDFISRYYTDILYAYKLYSKGTLQGKLTVHCT